MKSTVQVLQYTSLVLFGLGLTAGSARGIDITPTNDPNVLANTIAGTGITIMDATYNGAPLASGTFVDGLSSGIGIDEGIILTSGTATDAEGPNISDGTTTNNPTAGDPDLSNLIGGANTNDAAILEFDFTTDSGNLFFEYVFASEEYNEFTNSTFNDVFGFFVNDENVALIPGTNTPVAINTVNGGNPFGVNASNPQFYNNNDPTDGGPFFNIEYDGFTTIFTAQASGLEVGVEHNIKLAIADTGDSSLDSGVFIKADSFTSTAVPEPTSVLGLLALGAFGVGSVFKRKQQ